MIFPQILLTFVMAWGATAKIFDPCTLSKELKRVGAPDKDLADWMCIVKYESTYNTTAVGSLNGDGSKDWGLFQVNDNWWCKSETRKSANGCKTACKDLLNDDIKAAFECALVVKKEQGFEAWVAWVNRCQNIIPNEKYC